MVAKEQPMLVMTEEHAMIMVGKLMEEQYMLAEVLVEVVEGKMMEVEEVQVHIRYIHHLLESLQFVYFLELVKIVDIP